MILEIISKPKKRKVVKITVSSSEIDASDEVIIAELIRNYFTQQYCHVHSAISSEMTGAERRKRFRKFADEIVFDVKP